MKKFIIQLLCCLGSLQLSAQISALPTGAEKPVWRVIEPGIWGYYNEFHFYTGADTIMGDHNWHSLYSIDIEDPDTTFRGYYRVENSKAFIRPFLSSGELGPEYLLYDFSVEVGDTLMLPTTLFSPGIILVNPFVVLAVNERLIGGKQRKIIQLSTQYNSPGFPPQTWGALPIWVEGIGDIWHPFYYLSCSANGGNNGFCEAINRLTCVWSNSVLLFSYAQDWYFDPFPETCFPTDSPTRLYVDKDAVNGLNNGTSWENAFTDLQVALYNANPGDSIWVAEGIYKPAATLRSASFALKNGVAIYGGFNATETSLEQRNWEQYRSILSGDIGIIDDSTDNSYHVVTAASVDSTALLDGFVITKGYAVGNNINNAYEQSGGGLFVYTNADNLASTPSIINCTFEYNTARNGGGIHCHGVNETQTNPIIRNCVFKKNYAILAGGGIYKWGNASVDRPFSLENCLFVENASDGLGGALYMDDICGDITIVACNFQKNITEADGGACFITSYCGRGAIQFISSSFTQNEGDGPGAVQIIQAGSDVNNLEPFIIMFSNCSFFQNTSKKNSGGAVAIGNTVDTLSAAFYECIFSNNDAFGYGGGIDILQNDGSHIDLNIDRCTFTHNTASGQVSGAISVNGYAGSPMKHQSTISNTLFANNTGALFYSTGPPGAFDVDVYNCTFFKNGPHPILKYWSTNFNDSTFYIKMRLQNSILWEPGTPLEHLLENGLNAVLYGYTLENCAISVPACDLPGGEEACPDGNIFDVYPQFVDTLLGDFRLAACSPLIDMGLNYPLDSLGIFTDLSGMPRIQQSTVDIGAYERPASWQTALAETANVTCPEGNDGAAYFTSTGDDPISYAWQNQSGSGTGNTGLSAGNYAFTLTDAAGCTDTATVTIAEPLPLDIDYTITNATTPQSADGNIAINTAMGGTPPYSVLWSTDDTTLFISQLPAGPYSLTLTDANGCEAFYDFIVGAITSRRELNQAGSFTLLPNPAAAGVPAFLKYDVSNPAWEGRLRLYHSSGQLLWESDWQAAGRQGLTPIQTAQLPTGLYWLVLDIPGFSPLSWKWIVE